MKRTQNTYIKSFCNNKTRLRDSYEIFLLGLDLEF